MLMIQINRNDQFIAAMYADLEVFFKGELNVHKKWQSDDLFYIIINEIRPRVD